MTPDEHRRLLMELIGLQDSTFYEHLLTKRQEIIESWTLSDSEERDRILKGEKRLLDDLIESIEEAKQSLQMLEEGEQKTMQETF